MNYVPFCTWLPPTDAALAVILCATFFAIGLAVGVHIRRLL
jgi:hypothetical protein